MLNSMSSGDHERLSRLAALGACAAAAALCLYLLVRIVWLLLPRGDATGSGATAAAQAPASATVSVAKWHLFGNPQGIASATPASSLATVLKLGLRGTLALADPKDERALAIIANEQGVETSYRIGVEVAAGARLTEVYPDHVVLDHEGVAETLTLPRPDQHALASPAKNQQRLAAASTPAASVPPGPAPGSAVPNAAGASAMPRIDPQDVARQLKPVFADGRIVGADISGADASLLARLGLKPTDVVTAINGTPLAGVTNPQALMEQLQSSSSVQVTVQRDGKPATLTLSLR
ncbi:MAG TPA: type II secretion system protein N [Rhodanobacteraceae bacterium]|jgi:general secretion pathway protein C|nr:type II secretion system protein N [Rhodanobacteraceae bacterium]